MMSLRILLILPYLIQALFPTNDIQNFLSYNIMKSLANSTSNANCQEKLFSVVNNFMRDESAMGVLFNSGKGINDLGDYEECITDPKMRYILLSVSNLRVNIGLGICFPSECQEKDYLPLRAPLAEFLSDFFKSIGLGGDLSKDDIIFLDSVHANSQANLYTTGFYVCIYACGSLIIISILCSIYGQFIGYDSKTSCISKLIKCFDFIKNLSAVFSTTPSKNEEKELKIFNGLRVIVMGWIILGHVFFYTTYGYIQNIAEMVKLQTGFWYSYITNASFSVDIFFFLSAFLLTYLSLKQLHASQKLPYAYLYIHRVLRLWPLYFAMTVIFCYIAPLYGDGPAFSQYMELVNDDCKNYWYWNFLFINNFAPHTANCMGWVWYLANDMQFFIITPIIVTVYYKRKFIGTLIVVLILFGCALACFIISVKYKLSGATVKFSEDFFRYYYDKPYNRIVTYLLGILAAFGYQSYKLEESNFFTAFTNMVKKQWWLRWICYLISVGGMFIIIHTIYWMNNYPDDWSTIDDALYLTFAKILFVICLFLGIYPFMLGHGDIVRDFLAHPFFVPFARSTFGTYLIHPTLMLFFTLNNRKGIFYDYKSFLFTFGAYFIVSYFISFIATAIFESPVVSIDREFLRPKSKKLAENKDEELTNLTINSEEKD